MSDLIKELRELAASEEVADRAADEIERLTKLNNQKNADIGDLVQMYAEKCSTEPVAWRITYLLSTHPYGKIPVVDALITQDQANRIVADFKRRAIQVVTHWEVPVGNSAAGEMACEWTMQALCNVRKAIESLPLIGEK